MSDVLGRVDPLLPSTLREFYLLELASMLVFVVIAIIAGYVHHGRFDLYRVLRNGIGGGAGFPPAILLMLYPVSDRARALLGAEAVKAALMIGGLTGAVLILYGLLKK